MSCRPGEVYILYITLYCAGGGGGGVLTVCLAVAK